RWTEYIETPERAEYMLFPRLLALAEVVWSSSAGRDWDAFAQRLLPQLRRLDAWGVAYSRDFFRVKESHRLDEQGRYWVLLRTYTGDPIVYTLDGSEPGPSSPAYRGPIRIEGAATLRPMALREGRPAAPPAALRYHVSLATGRPVRYEPPFSEKDAGDREHALTTGVRGGRSYAAGWQGFDGTDLEGTIDLGGMKTVRRIEMGFLRDVGSWIMLPRQVELLASADGKEFRSL